MGGGDQPFLAGLNAKMAFLAEPAVDDDMSFQVGFLLQVGGRASRGSPVVPAIPRLPARIEKLAAPSESKKFSGAYRKESQDETKNA
ncbi:MAG: hypothetical protein KJ936_09695 [Proteobacteria bacterium]|nr:hypothetical protein [Pseudomonadota bacterium]MBU2227914.1 hypothetical protein [Pseudomonadota bacterium]